MSEACSRCIMDHTVPGLRLDADGICHLCHVQDRLHRAHFIEQDTEKAARFAQMIDTIKKAGKDKEFDCIVPLSGGGDSSYTLYKSKQLGLRPVAYHFDNGWVSDVARSNMAEVTQKLGVPLKTVSYPWPELRETYLASLRASIPEVCLPCLVGVWSLAYSAAQAEGVRYVMHGSSPMTEGIFPSSWSYIDGRYLESVVAQHGTPGACHVVKQFNRLRISDMVSDMALRRTRVVMLPLYLEWDDHRIRTELQREFNWGDGGKHADCIYTPFRAWVIWKKFGFDLRRMGSAALVRSGRVSRAKALEYFEENPPQEDAVAVAKVLERLGLSRAQLGEILEAPPKHFQDYATYHGTVQRMEPLVRAAVKMGLLSQMVYDKYFTC